MDENSSKLAASISTGSVGALSDLESRVLEFERNWWRYAGAKESAI